MSWIFSHLGFGLLVVFLFTRAIFYAICYLVGASFGWVFAKLTTSNASRLASVLAIVLVL